MWGHIGGSGAVALSGLLRWLEANDVPGRGPWLLAGAGTLALIW